MTQAQTEAYIDQAQEPYRSRCRKVLEENSGWEKLQQRFLAIVDEYIDVEIKKPLDLNISAHEAGGQFRIAFPHQILRGNDALAAYMKAMMEERKRYTDKNLFHGYVDCDEVHHEVETFIYFQQPLYYLGFPGSEIAGKSIVDMAEHTGNWIEGVPAWYNWEKHSFVSNWLGTKGVRDYPPYDYQEGNHFRFIDAVICAYQVTGKKMYLDLIFDYCGLWCDHIEKLAAKGEVISCSILPENAQILERNKAGTNLGESVYEIFYSLASDNTMYDIAGGLLDAFRISGEERFRKAAELLIDQFINNGRRGRPALHYKNGKWLTVGDPGLDKRFVCDSTFIARLALRYHRLTGSEKYKATVINWARDIDEEKNTYDQMMANVLVAAHYFDGDTGWLARAYRMAIRMWANCEHIDDYHQCAWTGKRQGSKFLMEMLYQPLLGDVEWGTRGNIPMTLLRHVTDGKNQLPEGVSFRVWHRDSGIYAWEAVNTGGKVAAWELRRAKDRSLIEAIVLKAGEKKTGEVKIDFAITK
jgi:hypothetical protein